MDPTLIECVRQGNTQWIRAAGRLTMPSAPVLRDALESATRSSHEVWLDLSQASHLDSTVIGCLVAFSKKAAHHGPELVLNNPSVGCLNALRQLKLHQLLRTEHRPAPAEGWLPVTAPVASGEELARVVASAHEQLAAEDPGNPLLARIAKAFRGQAPGGKKGNAP